MKFFKLHFLCASVVLTIGLIATVQAVFAADCCICETIDATGRNTTCAAATTVAACAALSYDTSPYDAIAAKSTCTVQSCSASPSCANVPTQQPAPTPTAAQNVAATINNAKPKLNVSFGGYKVQLSTITCAQGEGKPCEIPWIGEYIGVLYQYGIGLAAFLAVVMIMVGGFIWLMSAGSPDRVSQGKEFIIAAISGLVIALFSFTILNFINPNLVNLKPLVVFFPKKVTLSSLNGDYATLSNSTSPDTVVCSTAPSNGPYNLSQYNPEECSYSSTIYSKANDMGSITDAASAQGVIDKFLSGQGASSPITGQMVMNAANQYDVPPNMILAIMEQESAFGTQGVATRTFNPGNVGNWPGHETSRGDWQSGVNAIGAWLADPRHKN